MVARGPARATLQYDSHSCRARRSTGDCATDCIAPGMVVVVTSSRSKVPLRVAVRIEF